MGSTSPQVNPLKVHSEVVCLMPFSFMSRVISSTAFSWRKMELLGRKVLLVPNDEVNLKITYERDLKLAEAVLRQRGKGGDEHS